jgi:large subunit ribosomal protein L23
MIPVDQIIKEYRVTEKAANLSADHNQYTFEVSSRANRTEVALAVSQLFDVKVKRVNILIKKSKLKSDRSRRGRPGVVSGYKKAIVTLAAGEKIELV